jgi:hypothetical protein
LLEIEHDGNSLVDCFVINILANVNDALAVEAVEDVNEFIILGTIRFVRNLIKQIHVPASRTTGKTARRVLQNAWRK